MVKMNCIAVLSCLSLLLAAAAAQEIKPCGGLKTHTPTLVLPLSLIACFFFCSFSTSDERRVLCGQSSFVPYTPCSDGPGPQHLSLPSSFPQLAANLMSTGTIDYDAFGQRIRVRNFVAVGNGTFHIDQLMLFGEVDDYLWSDVTASTENHSVYVFGALLPVVGVRNTFVVSLPLTITS